MSLVFKRSEGESSAREENAKKFEKEQQKRHHGHNTIEDEGSSSRDHSDADEEGERKSPRSRDSLDRGSESRSHSLVLAAPRVTHTHPSRSPDADTACPQILLKALALVLVVTLTTAACGLVVLMGKSARSTLQISRRGADFRQPFCPPPAWMFTHTQTDIEEKKLSITHSWFGQFWLKINRGNPILQPALFNFSVLGKSTEAETIQMLGMMLSWVESDEGLG